MSHWARLAAGTPWDGGDGATGNVIRSQSRNSDSKEAHGTQSVQFQWALCLSRLPKIVGFQ